MPVVVPRDSILRRNLFVRELLRVILTRMSIHLNGNNEDVFIFSSRRSGSTWLMEALAHEKKMRLVNEPFGTKYISKSYLNKRGDIDKYFYGGKLFEIHDSEQLQEYLSNPKYTRICSAYNILNGNHHFVTNRRVFKIIHANPVLDGLCDYIPHNPKIYLIRNPVPTILSLSKGYPLQIGAFLKNKRFLSRLSQTQLKLIEDKMTTGTLLEKWAIEWSLDQLVPFEMVKEGSLNVVSYEQLVTQPDEVFTYLKSHFNLKNTSRILKSIRIPSASTDPQRLKYLKTEALDNQLSDWRTRVTEQDAEKISNIVESFGIDFYGLDNNIPKSKYLI